LREIMTVAQFRRIAVSLPGAEERAHMGHPDFRVGNKIFATLGSPDKLWGMVKITPEQQQTYLQNEPEVFTPAAGAWGRNGCTLVRLAIADPDTVGQAMTDAWKLAQMTPATRGRSAKRTAQKSKQRSA
jgi:hypothetical protein